MMLMVFAIFCLLAVLTAWHGWMTRGAYLGISLLWFLLFILFAITSCAAILQPAQFTAMQDGILLANRLTWISFFGFFASLLGACFWRDPRKSETEHPVASPR